MVANNEDDYFARSAAVLVEADLLRNEFRRTRIPFASGNTCKPGFFTEVEELVDMDKSLMNCARFLRERGAGRCG